MARFQPNLFVLVTLVTWSCSLTGSALAQGLPPALPFGTGQQICDYKYAIPSGEDCSKYAPALQQTLDAVQRDMDRVKLQFVSQNTVLLEEIRKLKEETSTTDSEVADLIKDFKDLQTVVDGLQATITRTTITNRGGAGAPTDAALQQMMAQATTLLRGEISQLETDINDAVNSFRTERQRDAVLQSTKDSDFQAELRQQQQNLTAVLLQLQQLQNRVNALPSRTFYTQLLPSTTTTTTTTSTSTPQPATTAGGTAATARTTTTTTDPLLVKLESAVPQLEARVSRLEKDYLSDVADLTHNVTFLLDLAGNHSLQLSSVEMEVDRMHSTELPALQQSASTTYDFVSQLQHGVLDSLKHQAEQAVEDVASLYEQVSILANEGFGTLGKVREDERQVSRLDDQVTQLSSRLNDLLLSLGITPETPSTRRTTSMPVPVPHRTFAVPSPRRTTPSTFFIPTPNPGN